jgi:hypothetical protein
MADYTTLDQIAPGVYGIPPLQPSAMDNWILGANSAPQYGGLGQSGVANIDPGSAMPGALPTLPTLPTLPNLSQWNPFDPNNSIAGNVVSGIGNAASSALTAAGKATGLSWLVDPTRITTVVVGILFIAGGLYLFGTSQIAAGFKAAIK